MDQFLLNNTEKRIERTIKALKANRMDARYIKDTDELHAVIKSMLPAGAEIASGGSMTLKETGVDELLRGPQYRYYYRGYTDPATGEPVDVYRKAYSCDWYFVSSNAVTETGELYNVDGNGNRISAMVFGPKRVVVIIGANKIVRDMDAAVERVRNIAAPANCDRLDMKSGCRVTGRCVSCRAEGRICCSYMTMGFQRVEGRVTVLILPESYGF